MIRGLYVLTDIKLQGVTSFVMNYYRCFDHKKINIDFAIHEPIDEQDIALVDEVLSNGSRIFEFPRLTSKAILGGEYKKAWETFFEKEHGYDFIHSHLPNAAMVYLKSAKKAGIRLRIQHSHNTSGGTNITKKTRNYVMKRSANKHATHYFACSKLAGKYLFGNRAVRDGDVIIIPNCININRFLFSLSTRQSTREALCLENSFVIGHVGRITPQKNQEFLIDIFSELYKIDDNAVLLLIGEGEDEVKTRQKAAKLGLESTVRFLGVRSDIPELMQAMDVFLFPSRFEGLGIVLIEAQAAGLPAIASDVVPQEVAVTDLISYMPLKEPAKAWAKAALALKGISRVDTSEMLLQGGYDIVSAAKELESLYLSLATG